MVPIKSDARLFQFSRPVLLIGVQYDLGERPAELHPRLRHQPRFRTAGHAPVHDNVCAKVPRRPAQVGRAHREQARLAAGHAHLAADRAVAAAVQIVATVTLADVQVDQPREPETAGTLGLPAGYCIF